MSLPTAPIDVSAVEQDDRFPTGPWEGYYLYPGHSGRFGMELFLTFHDGKLRGEGRDNVGDFLITGTYERDSGKCWWSKRYIGKHDVAYQGYNEGRGIWGVWEISTAFRGGFHIWPLGQGDGTHEVVQEEAVLPDLVETGVVDFGLGTIRDDE